MTTNGTGPNKKTAKRNAAEAMLQRMGYSRPIVPPGKPPVKSPGLEVIVPQLSQMPLIGSIRIVVTIA